MAKVVGDISVRVGADVSPLQRQMGKGKKSMRDFEKSSAEMAVNVAKAGAVVVTAMAAIAGGILKMAGEAAAAGVEIKNLSAVANTSTTTFQRMADASKTVGIEQEKLADILKDVNDKVGDFIVTGGGPMADFFENIAPKVGVTADQFARLGGPEALQLYVSSLEKAGVSQQQMTFYMEAIASDATALLPLLRDNGAEFARLGDEAERAGRILSDEMIANAAELDRELTVLSDTLKNNATKAVLEHKDEIILLVDFITGTLIPAVAGLAGTLSTVADGWRAIGQAAEDAISPLARALGLAERSGPGATISPENQAAIDADIASTNAMGGGDVSNTGTGYIDENGNWVEYGTGADQPTQPGINAPARVYSGRGQAAGPSADEATEALIEARREEFERLQELEQENSDRIVGIKQNQADEEARIHEAAMQREIAIRGKTVDMTIGLLQTLGQKSEGFAKAAVALNAAKAISETIQNTAAASVRALAELGPIAGPAAAARIKAYGAVQAGVIAANAALQLGKSGGGGGGGSAPALGGGAGSVAAPEAQTPQQQRSLTLVGDRFNRQQAIQIAEFMNEGTDNGLIVRGRT